VNGSRKLCSDPKGLDSRIVQPVTVQLISILAWLNICNAPTTIVGRKHRDPLFLRCNFDVWGVACEDGGLYNAHERVQKEGGKRDARDGRFRDRSREKGDLRVW
jgi:hypothetical protein